MLDLFSFNPWVVGNTARFNLRCPHRPCKKPLSPSCSVQMSDTKESPMPIPLLAAALGADPRSVLLAYGNYLQPVMENAVSGCFYLSQLNEVFN